VKKGENFIEDLVLEITLLLWEKKEKF